MTLRSASEIIGASQAAAKTGAKIAERVSRTRGEDGEEIPDPVLPDRMGVAGGHHPNVERWRDQVQFFFGHAGYANEVNYAMMVMWGESGGNPNAVGRTLNAPQGGSTNAHGLFQHMSHLWSSRITAAQAYWSQRGITIGNDPTDPTTNIAVAAWLRAVGGWGHWVVANEWYKPGAWVDGQTYWNGYEYVGLQHMPNSQPPRGDGQVAGWVNSVQQVDGFVNPVPGGEFISGWGAARSLESTGGSGKHRGIDLAAAAGSPIVAAAGGRVIKSEWSNDISGYTVYIDHGNGWQTRYMHIQEGGLLVREGQTVQAGQQIARVGNTGNARGTRPHLHFATVFNGQHVDPMSVSDYPTIGMNMGQQGEPKSQRDRISDLLSAGLDAISQGIAGGTERVPLDAEGPTAAGDEQVDDEDDPNAMHETEDPEDAEDELEAPDAMGSLGRLAADTAQSEVERPEGVT